MKIIVVKIIRLISCNDCEGKISGGHQNNNTISDHIEHICLRIQKSHVPDN